jgi:hypothetical protein
MMRIVMAVSAFVLIISSAVTNLPAGPKANLQVMGQKDPSPDLVDRGDIGYPLKGHIALTNVGKPVGGMLVECFVDGWEKLAAVTKTNSSGDFSFPNLPQGKYYVRASLKHLFTIRTIVRTSRKSANVLSLITEGCDTDCDSDPVLK